MKVIIASEPQQKTANLELNSLVELLNGIDLSPCSRIRLAGVVAHFDLDDHRSVVQAGWAAAKARGLKEWSTALESALEIR